VELEAESRARTWTPVLQVPDETVAVATFQWKRVPLTRGVLLRLAAIAAAIVIACGVLAFGVSEMLPKTYGARTEIVYPLSANNPSGDTLRTDRVLATQLVAIKSRQVLTPVAAKYHMTADQLSKKIIASVLQDSEVIRIEADDASQGKALKIVSDVSTAYLASAAKATSNVDVENALRKQISDANTKIATLNAQRPQSSAEVLQQQTQLNIANSQLSSATSQLNQLAINDASAQTVKSLTNPYAAGKVAPKPMRAGIAGVLAGMLIAAGVVVLVLRRRLRDIPADQFG